MNLQLHHEPGGLRHYLQGRPVSCGTQLEIQLGGTRGPWVPVRYESNLREPVSICLHAVGARLYPDEDATFRWPPRP